MYAHYYTGKKNGAKIHMMHITDTPALNGTAKIFNTAKEAKAYAKAIGAKAWNY